MARKAFKITYCSGVLAITVRKVVTNPADLETSSKQIALKWYRLVRGYLKMIQILTAVRGWSQITCSLLQQPHLNSEDAWLLPENDSWLLTAKQGRPAQSWSVQALSASELYPKLWHGMQWRLSLEFHLLMSQSSNPCIHVRISNTLAQYCHRGICTDPQLAMGWQPSIWKISILPHTVNHSVRGMMLPTSLNKKWEKHWAMSLKQCKIMAGKWTTRKFRELLQE